jgi:hypothetical protein
MGHRCFDSQVVKKVVTVGARRASPARHRELCPFSLILLKPIYLFAKIPPSDKLQIRVIRSGLKKLARSAVTKRNAHWALDEVVFLMFYLLHRSACQNFSVCYTAKTMRG